MRTAKTQISLSIRPAWSASSLSAWRKLGSLATHWVHSEDSDQTGRMPRLIWVFAERTFCWFCHVAAHLNISIVCWYKLCHWFWRQNGAWIQDIKNNSRVLYLTVPAANLSTQEIFEQENNLTNKMTCARSSEYSDQSRHYLPSLITIFFARPYSVQRRHWSDWADVRLIWVFAERTSHIAGFDVLRLIIGWYHFRDVPVNWRSR